MEATVTEVKTVASMMAAIDVIIPAYHPGQEFEELLEALSQQSCEVGKILVMNTEEKFWNPVWEKKFPKVQVNHLSKAEFDHGGTRRAAAKLSDADIMVFMTQDALPADRDLIRNLIRPLQENPQVGAAYARQLAKADCAYLEKYTRSFNYPSQSSVKWEKDTGIYGIKTYFCSNVCAAYKRQIYDEVGGFVPKAIFNEDMIYAGTMAKKGYGIAYAADAQVIHSHNYSCRQQFHRNFDLGVSQAEHPEIFEGVPSEGEGLRLVKKSLVYLIKTGHVWLVPKLIGQSGFKYMGYFLGKRYKKLPESVILFCTMNREYWKHNK